MIKRKSKLITNKEDINYLLNITEKDYNRSFMMETFGNFNGKIKFNPYDLIEIPPGYYGPENKKNKNKFTTTVGLWIYNKFFIEPRLFNVFGYVNNVVNKSRYGDMNDTLVYALLEGDISLEDYKQFITYNEFLMPFVVILAPNDSKELLTISSKVESTKKKLIKDNKESLDKGDIIKSIEIENRLIDTAMDQLKDDPALDSYKSGARASIGNNFKNIYLMKGAIKDPLTGEFNIATSAYSTGISSEEYHIFANSLAEGPYARTNKTKVGGYEEKLYVSAFQHIKVLPLGTDCGTTDGIETVVNNPKEWLYSYMIEGNKLVQLTPKNMDNYKGKKVKFRYSSMCKSKNGICSKCAGELFHKLGLYNVGLALALIPSKRKNLAMKSFHDTTKKMVEIDLEKAFGFNGTKKL